MTIDMLRGPPILGLILILLGCALLTVAVYYGAATRRFLASAIAVEGTVIDVDHEVFDDVYTPVVRFRARTGETIELRGDGSERPYYRGDTVTVLYEEGDPNHAEIKDLVAKWFFVIIIGFFGFLLIGGGINILDSNRRVAGARDD